jgi:hypothetical protein
VSIGKVCDGRLHLRKKRNKLVDRGKWLKETWLVVGLVRNSSFLNVDVGVTGLIISNFGKQIIMSLLVYFSLYFLVLLCFHVISCDVLHCLVDIVYVYF